MNIARNIGRASMLALGLLLAACGTSDRDTESASIAESEPLASLRTLSSAFANQSISDLSDNSEALDVAGRLFGAHCASCHGADGRGDKGVTDLTLGEFNYGADAPSVHSTIRDGRQSEMPGIGNDYGEVELGQIVAYVGSLALNEPLSQYEASGQRFFLESCAACHQADGRGQPALGAPDLADDYWQHGDSMMNIRLVITRGARSECPAQGDRLTPAEINLLTMYVLQLAGS